MKVLRNGPLHLTVEPEELAAFIGLIGLARHVLDDCMRSGLTPHRMLNRSIGSGLVSMREVAVAADLARRIEEGI